MAIAVVFIVIAGCAAYQYFKGSIFKAAASVICSIIAVIVAFGYYELLADVFLQKVHTSKHPNLLPWAQPLCLILIFIITFAILETIVIKLAGKNVELDDLPELIGKTVLGLIQGLVIGGFIVAVLILSPLSAKMPYQRFDQLNPNTNKVSKCFLNADGFALSWVNAASKGSLSTSKSFATVHPDFLDQAFLNRIAKDENISILTTKEALDIPKKYAIWPAPANLKNSNGNAISAQPGNDLYLVRIGITRKAMKEQDVKFTLSQIRVISKTKDQPANSLQGQGQNAYPIGYIKAPGILRETKLNEVITVAKNDLIKGQRYIDFAFNIPKNSVPAMVQFKQNCMVQLPKTSDQPETPQYFIPISQVSSDVAKVKPASAAPIYGVELAAGRKLLEGLKIKINDPNTWNQAVSTTADSQDSFINGKLQFANAILKAEKPEAPKPDSEDEKPKKKSYKPKMQQQKKTFVSMLMKLDDYKLLSLKCNNPAVGKPFAVDDLPKLLELTGKTHKPVGAIIGATVGDDYLYQILYSVRIAKSTDAGLIINDDQTVSQNYFDSVTLPANASQVNELYLLYFVKTDETAMTLITNVKSLNAPPVGLQNIEAFYVK